MLRSVSIYRFNGLFLKRGSIFYDFKNIWSHICCFLLHYEISWKWIYRMENRNNESIIDITRIHSWYDCFIVNTYQKRCQVYIYHYWQYGLFHVTILIILILKLKFPITDCKYLDIHINIQHVQYEF